MKPIKSMLICSLILAIVVAKSDPVNPDYKNELERSKNEAKAHAFRRIIRRRWINGIPMGGYGMVDSFGFNPLYRPRSMWMNGYSSCTTYCNGYGGGMMSNTGSYAASMIGGAALGWLANNYMNRGGYYPYYHKVSGNGDSGLVNDQKSPQSEQRSPSTAFKVKIRDVKTQSLHEGVFSVVTDSQNNSKLLWNLLIFDDSENPTKGIRIFFSVNIKEKMKIKDNKVQLERINFKIFDFESKSSTIFMIPESENDRNGEVNFEPLSNKLSQKSFTVEPEDAINSLEIFTYDKKYHFKIEASTKVSSVGLIWIALGLILTGIASIGLKWFDSGDDDDDGQGGLLPIAWILFGCALLDLGVNGNLSGENWIFLFFLDGVFLIYYGLKKALISFRKDKISNFIKFSWIMLSFFIFKNLYSKPDLLVVSWSFILLSQTVDNIQYQSSIKKLKNSLKKNILILMPLIPLYIALLQKSPQNLIFPPLFHAMITSTLVTSVIVSHCFNNAANSEYRNFDKTKKQPTEMIKITLL